LDPDDGGNKLVGNFSNYLPLNIVPYPRRLESL